MPAHRFLFHLPALDADQSTATIDGDEHHHLSRVLRLSAGDDCYVTSGRGLIRHAVVGGVNRERTELRVGDIIQNDPEPIRRVLALALIRKDRFASAFEQCVELGITGVWPFVAERSQVRRVGASFTDRLERIAVSAMKQSFRAWLPDVREPVSFETLVEQCADSPRVIVGDPDGGVLPDVASGAVIVVGPEAGLSGAELDALDGTGASRVSAGSGRLRAETAAVALTALVAAR